VGTEWKFVAAVVVGWPLPTACSLTENDGRVRGAFLRYLDSVRVVPERIELHTNTWWTLPLPFTEDDVLKDIATLQRDFFDRTGMFFDSFALDLGWSNPQSVWRVDETNFPDGFRNINRRLAALGCRLGLWISPGSAYPEGLDNAWLEAEGYPMTPCKLSFAPGRTGKVPCFALGGAYQQELRDTLLSYARRYQLGHVKLDFMQHVCDVADHGHPLNADSVFVINAGLAEVLDGLRAINPAMAIEPLCLGLPPSPWWTTKSPFIVGPPGADVPPGRVPCPEWMESLITARDVAYRFDQEKWIMPTQVLETFDIVMQCPGDFQNLAVMAVGRGRWFLSTYLKPELMKPTDWDFLAALVRWQRDNQRHLTNAWQIGGAPEKREAYGYMFHNPGKDIFCVRNPWIEERLIQLPACACATEARELRMIYPRRATVARLAPGIAAPPVALAPYETAVFETVRAGEEESRLTPAPAIPAAAGIANEPQIVRPPPAPDGTPATSFRYVLEGVVAVADASGAELCILTEGSRPIDGVACKVTFDDQEADLRTTGSKGQFSAADNPSPEQWTWFLAPVTTGSRSFRIELDVPVASASVGVYLRGVAPAVSEAAPDGVPAFPTFRAEQRAWSQTLAPVTVFSATTP
jgi:hypothetical protein